MHSRIFCVHAYFYQYDTENDSVVTVEMFSMSLFLHCITLITPGHCIYIHMCVNIFFLSVNLLFQGQIFYFLYAFLFKIS
jgi:hypothetical protein